jgi:hypothetical protein
VSDGSLRRSLGDLVSWFCEAARVDETEPLGHPAVRSLSLDLPVELSVERDRDDRLSVLASPPTQRVATSFLPVFHRLGLRIEREEIPADG